MLFEPFITEGFMLRGKEIIELFILKSRYLLVPLYCALSFGILTITLDFIKVLIGISQEAHLTEHTLQELQLVDITMIANLIWLIGAGSYYVFVDDTYPEKPKYKRPRCLIHISAGILKEKMAGSLIGVSSIHLLEIFLHIYTSPEAVNWPKMAVLLSIHLIFIVGLLAFNYANSADHHNHEEEQKPTGKETEHEKTHE